jgi:hypothetical protein
MKQETIKKIGNCKTLEDYLKCLQENFNTLECKPGRFIKSTLIYSLSSKLNAQSPLITERIKIKALESENIAEFIKLIQANFNTKQLFSVKALGNLVGDTEKLLDLTGLKEKATMPELIKKALEETKTEIPAKKKSLLDRIRRKK